MFTGSKTTSKKSSDSNKKKGDDEATSRMRTWLANKAPQCSCLPSRSSRADYKSAHGAKLNFCYVSNGPTKNRTERGLPISKIPYINRLFKNVGIGRTTQKKPDDDGYAVHYYSIRGKRRKADWHCSALIPNSDQRLPPLEVTFAAHLWRLFHAQVKPGRNCARY